MVLCIKSKQLKIMQKEKFYQIIVNTSKTLLLTTILALTTPIIQKDPTIIHISFIIFISSITIILYIYILINRHIFFITTILLSMFGYFGIVGITSLINPESIKFFIEFNTLFKLSSVLIVFIIRYFLKKKDLLFPIFLYCIGYKDNKTPQS